MLLEMEYDLMQTVTNARYRFDDLFKNLRQDYVIFKFSPLPTQHPKEGLVKQYESQEMTSTEYVQDGPGLEF